MQPFNILNNLDIRCSVDEQAIERGVEAGNAKLQKSVDDLTRVIRSSRAFIATEVPSNQPHGPTGIRRFATPVSPLPNSHATIAGGSDNGKKENVRPEDEIVPNTSNSHGKNDRDNKIPRNSATDSLISATPLDVRRKECGVRKKEHKRSTRRSTGERTGSTRSMDEREVMMRESDRMEVERREEAVHQRLRQRSLTAERVEMIAAGLVNNDDSNELRLANTVIRHSTRIRSRVDSYTRIFRDVMVERQTGVHTGCME